MKIFEWIYLLAWGVSRLVVWIITARDCEHCIHGRGSYEMEFRCSETMPYEQTQECENSICRKHFASKRAVLREAKKLSEDKENEQQ